MLPTSDVIRADFDRIATHSVAGPDLLEPAVHRLIAEVPLRSRVLEIGCGTGALSRELASKRGAKMTSIDLSPRMIDVARIRTHGTLGIDYRVADFMALSPRGFDVVIAVNTLHHLPLATAIERMAEAVKPGGLVLVADLFDASGLAELPYNGVSWLLRASRSLPTMSGSDARSDARKPAHELLAAWHTHGEHDDLLPLREIRMTWRAGLPGVAIRRHLGWRYTAIWRKS